MPTCTRFLPTLYALKYLLHPFTDKSEETSEFQRCSCSYKKNFVYKNNVLAYHKSTEITSRWSSFPRIWITNVNLQYPPYFLKGNGHERIFLELWNSCNKTGIKLVLETVQSIKNTHTWLQCQKNGTGSGITCRFKRSSRSLYCKFRKQVST
jgi:hypothetical protein